VRLKKRQGVDHHNSKLTEEDIPKIRKRLEDGVLAKEIAKEFGITSQQVSQIKLRRAWVHVL
jgi:DNA invertase Pin-like site-specific DNA recombinase